MSDFARLSSIINAQPNWYRVKGTKTSPVLEPVVCWAILEIDKTDNLVIGIIADDIGIIGNDEETYLIGIAGYVEFPNFADATPKSINIKLDACSHLIWEE